MHNGALYTVVDSLRQRVTAELKLADSRWDQRWVEPIPAIGRSPNAWTTAGQEQQGRAAFAAQLQPRGGHDVWSVQSDPRACWARPNIIRAASQDSGRCGLRSLHHSGSPSHGGRVAEVVLI